MITREMVKQAEDLYKSIPYSCEREGLKSKLLNRWCRRSEEFINSGGLLNLKIEGMFHKGESSYISHECFAGVDCWYFDVGMNGYLYTLTAISPERLLRRLTSLLTQFATPEDEQIRWRKSDDYVNIGYDK